MSVRVQLACVHRDMDGTETYELQFVDDDGNIGTELLVSPDGTLEVRTGDGEDQP